MAKDLGKSQLVEKLIEMWWTGRRASLQMISHLEQDRKMLIELQEVNTKPALRRPYEPRSFLS
jgi:hypothetical protein